MINAVGRDIPEEILKATGKEVFHRAHPGIKGRWTCK